MTKRNTILYWIATIWLALGMTATGTGQIFKINNAAPGGMDMMIHLGYPVYLMTIIGIWKILGVVAILIPKYPLLKEWAYAGFFFVMTGAIYSHIASGDPVIAVFPALLLLVLTIISWFYRPVGRKIVLAYQ